uniref:Uncharacterized protein n=1 Tax=Rhizophora mucronata TaxID=61149 RepID=A0A2P2QGE4_RHIMU
MVLSFCLHSFEVLHLFWCCLR